MKRVRSVVLLSVVNTLGSESGLFLYGVRLQMLAMLPLSKLTAHAGTCRHCSIDHPWVSLQDVKSKTLDVPLARKVVSFAKVPCGRDGDECTTHACGYIDERL